MCLILDWPICGLVAAYLHLEVTWVYSGFNLRESMFIFLYVR